MKTPKQIAEMIDLRTAGEDYSYFEIEVDDRETCTTICGEVSRRFIKTWGDEWYGLKEWIMQEEGAEIHIEDIVSFDRDGEPIPPIYRAEEIEAAFS